MLREEVLKGMFRPRNQQWKTSITKVEPNRLETRGHPQQDLIGNISFPQMVYLLLKGSLPLPREEKMLQAVLVSFCDHGVTPPSTQAARVIASSGTSLNACLAGGILAFGENHAGAIELAMKMLQEGVNVARKSTLKIEEIAKKIVEHFQYNQRKVPGFGHRYHQEDPRASKILKLAEEQRCYGEHVELVLQLEDFLQESKDIKANIDGANAAVLSDLGFDWRLGSGMFMIGRLPGILAHVHEELTQEKPFRKLFDVDKNDMINSF